MAGMGIKAILFDLGGVLIQLGGISEMMGWTGLDHDYFWQRWWASTSVREFEAGKLGASEFGAAFVEEFNLPVPADDFLIQFSKWPKGVFPGSEELLEEAAESYLLGCLSNTNALHWDYLAERTNLVDYFDFLFPSHLTGLLKPDRNAFTNTADKMGLLPGQILFLDDNQINIEGSIAAGLKGQLVQGAKQSRATLQELGILPDDDFSRVD